MFQFEKSNKDLKIENNEPRTQFNENVEEIGKENRKLSDKAISSNHAKEKRSIIEVSSMTSSSKDPESADLKLGPPSNKKLKISTETQGLQKCFFHFKKYL